MNNNLSHNFTQKKTIYLGEEALHANIDFVDQRKKRKCVMFQQDAIIN